MYYFVVALMVLLTGMRAVEFNGPEGPQQINLAMKFVSLIKEGRLSEILDGIQNTYFKPNEFQAFFRYILGQCELSCYILDGKNIE